MPNWRYGGTAARLRIYANDDFKASDGRLIWAGNPTNRKWYQEVACTVAGTNLTIPQFTIDSTMDSDVPTATYTAIFYDFRGIQREVLLIDFRVPVSLGTTVSWQQLRTYNSGSPQSLPPDYLTTDGVARLLGEHIFEIGQIEDFDGAVTNVIQNTTLEELENVPDSVPNNHTLIKSGVSWMSRLFTLANLVDALVTDPEEGEGLFYDKDIEKWVNRTVPATTDLYSLYFNKNRPFNAGFADHNVFHGLLYTSGQVLGKCFWQGWVCPDYGAQYFLAMGFGGSHPLLLGFNGATSGKLLVSGNVYNGSSNVSFTGVDGVNPGTWHHVAVIFDTVSNTINAYLDGVLTARVAFTGTRQAGTLEPDLGAWVGASNEHAGFQGKVLRISGFETDIPFNSPPAAFQPEKAFSSSVNVGTTQVKAVFACDYSKPSDVLIDYSLGFNGSTHSGVRTLAGYQNVDPAKLPQWVPALFAAPAFQGTISTPDPAAVIHDFFERDNETFAWGGGETANYPYVGNGWLGDSGANPGFPDIGILEGAACAVHADINNNAYTYRSAGKANYTITVKRKGTGAIAILFRRAASNSSANQIVISLSSTTALYVRTEAGVTTFTGGGSISNTAWTEAVVTVNGTSISCTVGGSTFPLTESVLTTGQFVGFGVTGIARVDEFKVV